MFEVTVRAFGKDFTKEFASKELAVDYFEDVEKVMLSADNKAVFFLEQENITEVIDSKSITSVSYGYNPKEVFK